VTSLDFLARYPEFAEGQHSAALVASCLAEAATQVSASAWGDLYERGVGLLAAHLLSTSPLARQARLQSQEASSTYWAQYAELRDMVGAGPTVT
jgi:hypothetical protein